MVYNDDGRVVHYYYTADGALSKITYGTGNSVDYFAGQETVLCLGEKSCNFSMKKHK